MELELIGFGELDGVELLQKLPIFARLTFEETNRLASIIQNLELPAGTIVIEENSLGDALYVIKQGEVKISRNVNADAVHDDSEELGRLGAGELFGEMSLVDDLLTSARVTAVTGCKLLKLPRADFELLLAGEDRFAVKVFRAFCRSLSDRLRRANQQIAGKNALSTTVK